MIQTSQGNLWTQHSSRRVLLLCLAEISVQKLCVLLKFKDRPHLNCSSISLKGEIAVNIVWTPDSRIILLVINMVLENTKLINRIGIVHVTLVS